MEGSRCKAASWRALDTAPFADGFDDWHAQREKDVDHVRIVIRHDPVAGAGPYWTKVVCWLRGDSASISPTRLAGMRWELAPNPAVVAVLDRRQREQGGYMSMLVRGDGDVGMTFSGRPSSVPIAFVFERFVKVDDGFRSVSIRLHHAVLR